MLNNDAGRRILIGGFLLLTFGQMLGVSAMAMDEGALCQQISDIARTEFKQQRERFKNHFKFKPNTSYQCEVLFMLKPDASVSNLRLGLHSAGQDFQSLSLRTITNSKFPKPDTEKDIPISMTFSSASESLSDIQTTAHIDAPPDRRVQK
jgi:hypothetical protein